MGGLQRSGLEPIDGPLRHRKLCRRCPSDLDVRSDRDRCRGSCRAQPPRAECRRDQETDSLEPDDRTHAATVERDSCGPDVERLMFAERSLSAFFQRASRPFAMNARTGGGPGHPISSGGRERAVLAHLLPRDNHPRPAKVLTDEVWGEEPPDTVRSALDLRLTSSEGAWGREDRREPSGCRLWAEPA